MRSMRFGPGFDLAGSRPYVRGDDVRRIDWRASARRSSARDVDEFVVREHLAETAGRVVAVVDRSARMAVCPPDLPWLSKPDAIDGACRILVDSALESGCGFGYLDDADALAPANGHVRETPFWRPPTGRAGVRRTVEPALTGRGFAAPADTAEQLLRWLAHPARSLAAGTFVFVLSDFLRPPSDEAWLELLVRGLDPVPVVIQDPVWERSFPAVAGAVLPVAEPQSGRLRPTRLGRRDVETRRRENEARVLALDASFERLGLAPATLGSSEPGAILTGFMAWVDARRLGARLAR